MIVGPVAQRVSAVHALPVVDGEGHRMTEVDRRGLDAGGPRADERNPLAGEVDAVVRPCAGVVPVALEPIEARDVGDDGAAARGDDGAAEGEAAPARLDPVRAGEMRRGLDHLHAHAAVARRAVIRRDAGDGLHPRQY